MRTHRFILTTTFPILLSLTMSCGGESGEAPPPQADRAAEPAAAFANISVAELEAMMEGEGDPFLVNVHIPFEGDIPGTDASIRFDQIADHLDQLPDALDSEIVLYCRSGRMSEEAAATLISLGYTNVANLVGGFRAWEAAGHQIER